MWAYHTRVKNACSEQVLFTVGPYNTTPRIVMLR
jgi:hypothetical protein